MSRDRRHAGLTAVLESKAFRAARRFLRRSWTSVLVGLVALALAVAAVVHPGFRIADLHLDEASVYVVRQANSLVGNLNMPSEELANAALVGAQEYEVIQAEDQVLVKSSSPNQISSYDPATNQMGTPTNLPNSATVSVGGGLMVVANPTNGRAWFGPVNDMLRTDFQLAPAQLEVGDGGMAIATSSGRVIGLNVATSSLVRVEAGVVRTTPVPLNIDPANAGAIMFSAVGENAVVLDRATQRIWVEGSDDVWPVDGGSSAQLPEPAATASGGVDGARAVYATAAGLIAVTKDGPRSLSGLVNDTPVQPLVVGDCVYGAFGDQFAKRCKDSEPVILDIPQVPAGADLRFATNRGAVVLNDAGSGYIWLVDDGMKLITEWDDVTPSDEKNNDNPNNDTQVINPDRKGPNQPPVAKDDMSLAAREGRSTILPVLDNDFDPDGDILTILGPPTVKGGPTFQLVNGGSGLQVTIPDQHAGAIDFDYTISDGRGKSATAKARINVLPDDQQASNQAPYHLRPEEKLVIAQLQKGTKRVLLDWRDPDGDDLILVGASIEGGEDEVTFTADGTLNFQDVGKTTGTKKVILKVSDGVAVTEGELTVEVVKGRIAAPVANGDFYTTTVGTDLVLDPLTNDQGENLTLREVTLEGTGQDDAKLVPNYHENTISFNASAPGIYYLVYTVSNGPVSTGLVRVDVRGESKQNNKPVAARDVVLLPPGGSVLLDPLANDHDDDGDVLVIQSFDAPSDLKVEMQNRHLLTIGAHRTPDRPLTITYWISDGTTTAPGTIVVVPTQLSGSQRPEAKVDEVKARAGSIVTIPALANDTSPIGLELRLRRIVEGPKDRAWIDGEKIRVAVPSGNASSSMSLTYEVADSDGRTASSVVNITIVSPDAQNEAPTPRLVEARVLQGTTTRILIPLDGIDPNGDPVRLVGLGAGPRLGRVMQVGENHLSYEAFPTSQGTDVFRYMVVDSQGASSTGEIRVGIAPQVGGNNPPTTGDDVIRVKPGAAVTLPLLLNDVDMDGDNIGFVDKDAIDLDIPTEIVNGNAIRFTAPAKAGTHAGKYYVRDSANTLGNGNITIVVDPAAPPLPPVAEDDLVQAETVVDKEYVEVEVLKNDYDLDADATGLVVEVPTLPGVSVVPGSNAVRIKVEDVAQQVRYTITDADGGSSTAVVTLPGRNDLRPTLKDPDPITVTAGERVVLDLNQIVAGTRGRPVKLVSADRVYYTTGTLIPSPQKLEWTPSIDYDGPAAVVFEVVDVVPDGDKTARNAYISLPVTVMPAPNVDTDPEKKKQLTQLPPELIGAQPVLEVGAGEGETRIDLRTFFRDPNGDEFRFERWARTAGDANLTWRAVGDQQSLVYAEAHVTAKPGSSIALSGRVLDIHGNDRPVQMTIKVVPSTRPRPTAVTDLIPDANAGSPRSVDVLANDKSNLLKDTSLTLVSARSLGGGEAKVSGKSVVVTPPAGYVGDMTVEYTIVDATGDPARQSTGRIVLTVRAEPGPPGVPREVKAGDGYVTLQWTDGAANGLPILSRTLRVTRTEPGGTSKQVQCSSNTCTIDGLANGRNYWFQVTQTNELGSATSPESAPSKPDVIPEVVGQPSVKFGNGQLSITWPTGVSRGSPITEYRVTMNSGGSAQPVIVQAPNTTLHWKGLTNDQDYTFTVAAKNVVGWSKAESPATLPEHPTGPPQPATNVVGKDAAVREGRYLTIDWDAAPIKKDPILRYDVFATRVSNGQKQKVGSINTDGRQSGRFSLLWGDAENDVDYTFTVVAHNRGPDPGEESAPSAPASAFGAPNTPRGANIRAGDASLFLAYGDPSQPKITEYEVEVYNGWTHERVSGAQVVSVGAQIPGTFTNGVPFYAKLRAKNQTKYSDWGATNSVTPVGTPNSPDWNNDSPAVPGDGAKRQVTWVFYNSYLQGNPMSEITIQYSLDGGSSWASVPEVKQFRDGIFGDVVVTTNGTNKTILVRAASRDHGTSSGTSLTVNPPIRFTHNGADNSLTLTVQGFGGAPRCDVSAPYSENNVQVNGSVTIDYKSGPLETPAPGPYTVTASCKSSLLSQPVKLTGQVG